MHSVCMYRPYEKVPTGDELVVPIAASLDNILMERGVHRMTRGYWRRRQVLDYCILHSSCLASLWYSHNHNIGNEE
jgi:hypothetical protein